MSSKGQRKVRGNKRKYFEEVLEKKSKYFEEELEGNTELLPKLPNDITVQLICTKLPWRTFHVLSSVSRAWLGAIQTGEINDTRVRSGTAETLAFLEYSIPDTLIPNRCAMALYSLRDKAIYRLPILPPFEHRQSYADGGCVTLGGKVYILLVTGKMWVLDVAGQKKWQRCASMHTPREDFACAVLEGEIYVFGGYTLAKQFTEGRYTLRGRYSIREQFSDFSEVYNPKLDAWTKISPMKFWKSNRYTWVGAIRDEVLVDAGEVYHRDYNDGFNRHWRRIERSKDGMQAYNPAKDSWRTIPPEDFREHELQVVGSMKQEKLFTTQGRLYSFYRGKISVIDLEKKSVKGLHTCSFKTCSDNQFNPLAPFWHHQVLVTNDGLLTLGNYNRYAPPLNRCRLYQSGTTIELGIRKKKLVLEEVEFSPVVSLIHFSCMEPIQL